MRNRIKTWIVVCLGAALTSAANADPPRTGMPVAELFDFEMAMNNYMIANDISAGLLGIMKDGVVVYQRGFGWKDEDRTIPLRHDAIMRLASLTKPITAAALQKLFAAGTLDPEDFAFHLGQAEGGVLLEFNYPPFPSLGDANYADIRLRHLYTHTSGMPTNNSDDPMFKEREIARAFNQAGEFTDNPPGRIKTLRWTLGQPLQGVPGEVNLYSNVAFLALSLIIEQTSGQDMITFVRNQVLGPLDWVPATELIAGRTFMADQDPREPWYDNDGRRCWDVFGPRNRVDCPYGKWHHEQHIGGGSMVAATSTMLNLAYNYRCSHNSLELSGDPIYGSVTTGIPYRGSHNGSLAGTNTLIRSREDGVIFCILFNKSKSGDGHYAIELGAIFDDMLDQMGDDGFAWPTRGVDGQWIDFDNPVAGNGSYENSWSDFDLALASSPDKATLNFRSGDNPWTGTINQRIRLRAPQPDVSAVIGIPN